MQDLLGTRGFSIEGRGEHLKGDKGIMGKQPGALLPSDRTGSHTILFSRRVQRRQGLRCKRWERLLLVF